jgi:hypothetical protein
LGISTDELALTGGCGQLRPGQRIVVFTDGSPKAALPDVAEASP